MTTQLALDFGEDARAARRPARPTVPARAGLRAVKGTPARNQGARDTGARDPGARDTAKERLRPAAAAPAGPAPEDWRLDERTKAIGVRGVEEARRILAGISTGHAA